MKKRHAIDHVTMREMNLASILNTARLNAPLSRADIASQTNLNKASVSTMVKELIEQSYLYEIGRDPTNTDVGRPGIQLQMNPNAGYLIGMEIGVDFLSIVVTDFNFNIVSRVYENTLDLKTRDDVLNRALHLLTDVYHQTKRRGASLFGIAIGIPGLVDMNDGVLMVAPNLGWRDYPMRQFFESHFPDTMIIIANEANMSAFGESYVGASRNSQLLLYISSGVGLGGGLVINGRMLTGTSGLAGEFGHMTIQPEGLLCRCGNRGCWETLATLGALLRTLNATYINGKQSPLLKDFPHPSIEQIVQAAETGDLAVISALESTAHWLGIGFANLINALNPDDIVFGGKLSVAHQWMTPIIQEEIEKRAFEHTHQQVHFHVATHVADACVMGGIAMLHSHVVKAPLSWRSKQYDASA